MSSHSINISVSDSYTISDIKRVFLTLYKSVNNIEKEITKSYWEDSKAGVRKQFNEGTLNYLELTQSTRGGYIVINSKAVSGDTITINGTTWTFAAARDLDNHELAIGSSIEDQVEEIVAAYSDSDYTLVKTYTVSDINKVEFLMNDGTDSFTVSASTAADGLTVTSGKYYIPGEFKTSEDITAAQVALFTGGAINNIIVTDGYITESFSFNRAANNGDSITINGNTFTFKDSPITSSQISTGTGISDQLDNLAYVYNNDSSLGYTAEHTPGETSITFIKAAISDTFTLSVTAATSGVGISVSDVTQALPISRLNLIASDYEEGDDNIILAEGDTVAVTGSQTLEDASSAVLEDALTSSKITITKNDIGTLYFVKYSKQITKTIWDSIKNTAALYKFVPSVDNDDNIYNLGIFELDCSDITSDTMVNNLVIVDKTAASGNNEFIASRYFDTLINLDEMKKVTVSITPYRTASYSPTSTIATTVDFTTHIDTAYTSGANSQHAAVITCSVSNGTEKDDGLVEGAGMLVNEYESLTADTRTVFKHKDYNEDYNSSYDYDNNDKIGRIQIKQMDAGSNKCYPEMYCGKGHKYSMLLWFYLDKKLIQDTIRTVSGLENYNLDGDNFYLGFNEREGAYLYYYDFTSSYIIIVIAGSNNYNNIDIFIAKQDSNNILSYSNSPFKNNLYRLKINKWYNRIYFVIPSYSGNATQDSGKAYVIYPNSSILGISNSPTASKTITTIKGELKYNVHLYPPDILVLNKMLEDYTQLYMSEFSDIGDVLINAQKDSSDTIISKYINIFGNSLTEWDFGTNSLLNQFSLDNRPNFTLIGDFYSKTVSQLCFLIENGYNLCYLGSEYCIAYDNTNSKYVIFYKFPRYAERSRRDISDTLYRIAGPYLIYKDYNSAPLTVESIYGKTLSNNNQFFGTNICPEYNILNISSIPEAGDTIRISDDISNTWDNTWTFSSSSTDITNHILSISSVSSLSALAELIASAYSSDTSYTVKAYGSSVYFSGKDNKSSILSVSATGSISSACSFSKESYDKFIDMDRSLLAVGSMISNFSFTVTTKASLGDSLTIDGTEWMFSSSSDMINNKLAIGSSIEDQANTIIVALNDYSNGVYSASLAEDKATVNVTKVSPFNNMKLLITGDMRISSGLADSHSTVYNIFMTATDYSEGAYRKLF